MNPAFSTVEEYIDTFDNNGQNLLQDIRKTIASVLPIEAKETINYGMPTIRYNGNLIHYALYKKHLGLYPGTKAIEAFSEHLSPYKTSKGAIQFPLDKPLPKDLIKDIVLFNVDLLKDRKAADWNTYKHLWHTCDEFMNTLIQKTALTKTHKWGSDVYTYEGKNIISWGGFKDFFAVWFYNGVFLEDKDKVLINASEGKTKALRQWRFKDVKDMDEQQLLNYINESIQNVKEGKLLLPSKSSPLALEGHLKAQLEQDNIFQTAFDSITPGRQREYIQYIQEAKQEKTKLSRIEKIRPMILAGKGLNDKYK